MADPITVTVEEIRAAINIPEEQELSDDVIASAITRATDYITILKSQYNAPSDFFPPCGNAYAIYLAYQAYSDRVLNVPPGAYQEGKWDPIAEEIVRSTGDKLATLREAYLDLEKIIKSYPNRPLGLYHYNTTSVLDLENRFRLGMYDYA
jgi:hypothetical protein